MVPGHRATVEVALAWMGGTPAKISAGKERKLPPPAIEFMMPAPRAARNRRMAFAIVMVALEIERSSVLQTKALSSHKLAKTRARTEFRALPEANVRRRHAAHVSLLRRR